MNINSILKREKIEVKSKLDQSQVDKIANIISTKICDTFPEHNLNFSDVYATLFNLNMYVATMPSDSSVAKYFYKNNSIYFSDRMNFENIDTLAIHECLHALQEIKNTRGKLLRLGLYNLSDGTGEGINEAAIQIMSAKATGIQQDSVKYYNMDFSTPSPLFYPLETALINQIVYFTGSYPLFHSTLFSNDVFKNTLISKCNQKVYQTIETNFDLLIKYEGILSLYMSKLANCTRNQNTIHKLNTKINSIKNKILNLTLTTQNLIIENCFHSEFELIRDSKSLNHFRKRLYEFNHLVIKTESYKFYHSFYCEMMKKLEQKEALIRQYGVLNYLNDLQTNLLDLEKDNFGIRFFHKLFDKLKLLFEETIRDKSNSDI